MFQGAVVVRLSKIVMTGGLAFWAFLVTLGNITDYDSNWLFVQHVLSMDTVFPDSNLKWRAITNPTLQRGAYITIIIIEGFICLAFLFATIMMVKALKDTKAAFQRAKTVTAIGVILSFLLWFVGFMGVGAEWFLMWQSSVWNSQNGSFRIYMTVLAVAVYVFLDSDGEVENHTHDRVN